MKRVSYTATHYVLYLSNAIIWLRNQTLKNMNLTSSQSDAIRFILKNQEKKSLTAADLMTHLQLSQSTIAGIIKRLEAKGLIEKEADPEDSRKNILKPTAKGLRLEEYLKSTAAETERIMLQGMSDTECREFNRLLQIALANMRAARGTEREVQSEYKSRVI